jgi:homoserine O-acetyltransferase
MTSGKLKMVPAAILLYLMVLGAGSVWAQGQEGVYTIPTFTFETGESMRDMKVGYVTHGILNNSKDNAILIVPGTSGNRRSHDGYIGPGKAFDTNKYFVVAVDAIGGGNSSQPKDGLGGDFPRYSIRDMVKAQHELITKHFGLTRIKAVGGASMGAFQSLEWAINYPEMVGGIILLVPSARAENLFKVTVKLMIDAIMLDPKWKGGKYSESPTDGLRTAGLFYFPWIVTDAYINSLTAEKLAKEYEESGASFLRWDAWGVIRRYQASSDHDVSRPFGGDMAKALSRIKASVLLLPASSDRLLGVEAAREIARLLPQAIYAEVPTIMGHRGWRPVAGSAEMIFMTARIIEFLERLKF